MLKDTLNTIDTARTKMNEFLTSHYSCATIFFEKTVIEVRFSHLYAYFGTFYVQMGHLFKNIEGEHTDPE